MRALARFITKEAWPRKSRVLGESILWLSVLAGLVSGQALLRVDFHLLAHTFFGASLTYSSIALGFCVTGVTMTLAFADQSFVRRLVSSRVTKDSAHCMYSDLLFVFTWTAFVHLLLIASSIICLFAYKPTAILFEPTAYWAVTGMSGFVVGLQAYALLQFLSTVLTLSTVGCKYIEHLERAIKEDAAKAAAESSGKAKGK